MVARQLLRIVILCAVVCPATLLSLNAECVDSFHETPDTICFNGKLQNTTTLMECKTACLSKHLCFGFIFSTPHCFTFDETNPLTLIKQVGVAFYGRVRCPVPTAGLPYDETADVIPLPIDP